MRETGEAHIGTFELQPSAGDPRDSARPIDRPWRDARTGTRSPPAPTDAEHRDLLFHDAMDDLAAGETASAQRLFEHLIARAPDSEYAARARRQFADIYNADRETEPGAAKTALRVAPLRARPASGEPPANHSRQARASKPKSRSAGRWVSPDTEMKFILDAGDRVFFSAGTCRSWRARAQCLGRTGALAQTESADLIVSVEGHADDLPLDAAQQSALAASRAEAVRQRLIAEGVEPERIIDRVVRP